MHLYGFALSACSTACGNLSVVDCVTFLSQSPKLEFVGLSQLFLGYKRPECGVLYYSYPLVTQT